MAPTVFLPLKISKICAIYNTYKFATKLHSYMIYFEMSLLACCFNTDIVGAHKESKIEPFTLLSIMS